MHNHPTQREFLLSKLSVSVKYVILVKCHVQTAARLISVSHFHALLMKPGITHQSVSAPWPHALLKTIQL